MFGVVGRFYLSLRECSLAISLLFCLSHSRRALSCSSRCLFLRSCSRSFSFTLACFPNDKDKRQGQNGYFSHPGKGRVVPEGILQETGCLQGDSARQTLCPYKGQGQLATGRVTALQLALQNICIRRYGIFLAINYEIILSRLDLTGLLFRLLKGVFRFRSNLPL